MCVCVRVLLGEGSVQHRNMEKSEVNQASHFVFILSTDSVNVIYYVCFKTCLYWHEWFDRSFRAPECYDHGHAVTTWWLSCISFNDFLVSFLPFIFSSRLVFLKNKTTTTSTKTWFFKFCLSAIQPHGENQYLLKYFLPRIAAQSQNCPI